MVKAWADGVRIYYIKVRASAVCRYSFGEKAPQSHDVDAAIVHFAGLGCFAAPTRPLFSYSQHIVLEYINSGAKLRKFAKKKND